MSAQLVDAVGDGLARWVVRSVVSVVASSGATDMSPLDQAAAAAGRAAVDEVVPALEALFALGVDEQRASPLGIVRQAVRFPTAVLADAGVAPVERSAYQVQHFPDDLYGLTPMTFADLDPALGELGLVWGAAKARAHLARHRTEG